MSLTVAGQNVLLAVTAKSCCGVIGPLGEAKTA